MVVKTSPDGISAEAKLGEEREKIGEATGPVSKIPGPGRGKKRAATMDAHFPDAPSAKELAIEKKRLKRAEKLW
jgi:hypothetical protein